MRLSNLLKKPFASVGLALLAVALPASAAAHTASLDVMAGAVRSPAEREHTPWVGLNLFGAAELRNTLNVDLGYTLLDDGSSSVRHLLTTGAEYLPTDRWSLALWGVFGPPRDSTYRRAPPRFGDARLGGEYDVSDWSAGANVAASYDSFGESDFEWIAELGAGLLHYDARQTAAGFSPAGALVPAVRASEVNQLRLSAAATAVLFLDTDVTLRASYFGYDASPLTAGFIERAGGPIGRGVATAPLRLELRPSVTHRFAKRWSATLGFGYGRYVDGGDTLQTVLQAGYRTKGGLRLFGYLTGQRDVFGRAAAVLNGFAGLGAEYRFE